MTQSIHQPGCRVLARSPGLRVRDRRCVRGPETVGRQVLLAQIAGFVALAVTCNLFPRLPGSRLRQVLVFAPTAGLLCGGIMLGFLDYDALGYALLLLGVMGSALAAVFLGGRGLSRAEILN